MLHTEIGMFCFFNRHIPPIVEIFVLIFFLCLTSINTHLWLINVPTVAVPEHD